MLGVLQALSPVRSRSAKMMGGEILAHLLAEEGVERVFGIIDGTYFGLYSTLRDLGIELVSPRHESSAAHMAGAYARLTGRLGVCIASNGPGVANILPGVAVENAEGNRVLLITSCRRRGTSYPDRGGTYQCFPQVEVTRPMTKWSGVVPSAERLAELMRHALRVSWQGRPGVVHLDVPEDIMNGKVEVRDGWLRSLDGARAARLAQASAADVSAAADLLVGARRPLIHAGSGVLHAGASEAVERLAVRLQAALTTSWGGRGATREDLPNAVPLPYLAAVKKARREADVVLVLGSRLGETDWWGKPPYWASPAAQRMVQVDLDASIIGAHKPADLGVQAEISGFLAALDGELDRRDEVGAGPDRQAWLAEIGELRRRRRRALDKHRADRSVPLATAHVPALCGEVLGPEAVYVLDGGNTAVWGHFFLELGRPGSLLHTAKMGMLGAGVGQALGAAVAEPDRRVCCIIGDGAMGFHQQEIETALRHGLAPIFVVLCDRQWGMVKMNQQVMLKPLKTLVKKSLSSDETINADFAETRFDLLGQAMGARGERVRDPEALRAALERAREADRCTVIHVDVDPVKHMWAPDLRAFRDMHHEPKG